MELVSKKPFGVWGKGACLRKRPAGFADLGLCARLGMCDHLIKLHVPAHTSHCLHCFTTRFLVPQVQLLARLAKVLGSPYAELLWTQAAAAMALGLATEFLYTTVIGL